MSKALDTNDAVVVTSGQMAGKSGWVNNPVGNDDTVRVRFPNVAGATRFGIEELRKLLPAGTRVRFDSMKMTGVVVGPEVPLSGTGYTRESYVNCERVREDGGGRVMLWHRDSITVLDGPTELWPVGTLVRDKRYGSLGIVVEHRAANPANPADTSILTRVRREGNGVIASFPHPEEALERVHILTRDELSVLEDALRGRADAAVDRSLTMLNELLHPKQTQTFMVTVEMSGSLPKITVAGLTQVITGDGTLHDTATVHVVESNEENER